ncbi:class III extradiol ring-cleavage dioxygenase [Halarcobacter sp.]|uniref:DODA-type extradiol aromatic ring-opening family dioxygenase n=1 Tax=Halarcobacter sp. TaxID=2321133 RepID=UPI002AA73DE3|nr:class III extradiol ring-cleavage dioxygenase [Halarcobacter sp.]
MLPSIYISHGSPQLMIMKNNTTEFLNTLSTKFEKPKYILVISAHWVTNNLKVLYEESPSLIYDFYNFPKELYKLTYPANSDLKKADEILNLLINEGFEVEKDYSRGGYDHGVWSPLRFMYPKADIPIIQLSLPYTFNQYQLFKLGEALQSLRKNTLIIASGAITHNLRDSDWIEDSKHIKDYAKDFHDWVVENSKNGDYKTLLDIESKAKDFRQNHPTPEHFLPFYITLGNSKNKIGESLHDVYMYGNQSMDTIIFKE